MTKIEPYLRITHGEYPLATQRFTALVIGTFASVFTNVRENVFMNKNICESIVRNVRENISINILMNVVKNIRKNAYYVIKIAIICIIFLG